MHRRDFHACCALGALFLTPRHTFAAEEKPAEKAEDEEKWGNLSATFLYDGLPPEPRRLVIDKDLGFYKEPIFDESLVVDAKTKGVANVVAWLDAPSNLQLSVHHCYGDQETKDVILDTVRGNIAPRITLLRTTQTLCYINSEPIGHAPKSDVDPRAGFSELIPPSGKVKRKYAKRTSRPMPVACNIHPWESGWILVRDNPYMAVSNTSGKLQIKNLPVGKHTFVLWHELVGYLPEFKRDGKVEKLDKGGRLIIDIKPGDNDLGEIVFKPARR